MSSDYEVVWSGKDSLLPDRPERWDSRFSGMPSFDLEEGEKASSTDAKPKRSYNKTGKFKGICSRKRPNAYIPKDQRT